VRNRQNITVVILGMALLIALLAVSCKQKPTEEKGAPAAKKQAPAGIGANETLGFPLKLGERFQPQELTKKLARADFPVQVAAEDATDRLVPGTLGDGTLYFFLTPDPRTPELVGGLKVSVDLDTAKAVGLITEERRNDLVQEARAKADSMSADDTFLARYTAAEAQLAAARNPEVARTAEGLGIGSAKADLIAAYGETKDMAFESGDTTLIYRGKDAAVAFRLTLGVVRSVTVFPPDYDYLQFLEDTAAVLSGKPIEPREGEGAGE
jgi:hypothetical protein